jgi:outer membrane protein assembly factor BamA/autotransporter translocation and assembly factor TamB
VTPRTLARRALRLVARAGLLVAVLAVLALGFLHTPWGEGVASALLERVLARAGRGAVLVSGLRLRLWAGEAAAGPVRFSRDGLTLDVERVEARWSRATGPALRFVRPSLVVRGNARGREAQPQNPQPWRALERFARVDVAEGRLELRDAKDAPWLVLGRLDLEGKGGTRPTLSVRVADAAFGWPGGGVRVEPATAEAALAVEAGRLVLERARLMAAGCTIALHGRLERLSPLTATGAATADLDGALAATLAPEAKVEGRLAAEAAVALVGDRVEGTIAASAPALTVAGAGPWEVSGSGRIDGPRLVVESLVASGYGGRLRAEGALPLSASTRTDVVVRAEGFDVARLAARLAGARTPVAARADAWVRWTASGWDVESGRGEGEFTLRPTSAAPDVSAAGAGIPVVGGSRIRLSARKLALDGARLATFGAEVSGELSVESAGVLGGRFEATVPAPSVSPILAALGAPAPAVLSRIRGALVAEGELGGTARSPALTLSLRGDRLGIGDRDVSLEGETRLGAGGLELAPIVVRSGEGKATLTGRAPVGRDDRWAVDAALESFETAPLLAAAGLSARGAATGTLRVEGPRAAPRVRGDLAARLAFWAEAGAEDEPVTVALRGSSDGSRSEVERLAAEVGGGRIEGSGRFDAGARTLEIEARAAGLAWARLPRLSAALRRLDGGISAEVSLSGPASAPSGHARVAVERTTIDGSPLPGLELEARADGRGLDLAGRSGDKDVLRGTGRLEGDWPASLTIDTAALPLQAVVDAFPEARALAATAVAQGELKIDVALLRPEALRYAASGLSLSGRLRDLAWSTETFRLEGDRESVSIGGLRMSARGTSLSVDGKVPLAPAGRFDLAVVGDSDLDALSLLRPDLRPGGKASLRLQLAGTAEEPEATGDLFLDGARGRFEGARWSELGLRARFLGREVEVEELKARLLGGRLQARGRLPLRPLAEDARARLSVEATDVDLARVIDPEARTAGASLLVSVEGEIESERPGLAGMRGRGRITRLESKSPEGTFGLDAPAAWTLEAGRFVQSPLRLTGPRGTLEAQAEALLAGEAAGGSASVEGPFDLLILTPFLPDTTVAGPAQADVRARWGRDGLHLEGSLRADAATIAVEPLAFTATAVTGDVRFGGARASLEAAGVAGEGRLRATGTAALGPGGLGAVDLALEADRVPLAYPPGFRGRASGTIRLSGDAGKYGVSGEVALRQGYYTRDFDARTQSLGRLEWQLGALRGGTVAEKLPLAVNVKLEDPLRIRNDRARVDVLGTFTVSGTVAQPSTSGQMTLRDGGTVTVSRASVRVSQGLVELNGYPEGTPELDFDGATRVGGVAIAVQARGTFEDLQLTLTSSDHPEMSQTDLVSLILTGRTAATATTQGGAIMAEELAAALGGRLQKGVGERLLIDVSPDRSLLADDTDPTQRFNVGTRLSDNLFVMYSTALDGTEKRWILDFNPGGGRFRFRLIDDEDGSVSVEATDRLSFDLWSRGRRTRRRERELDRLAAVRFEGALPLPEEELRRAMKLRTGRRHSALQREEAADRVRAALGKKGWRAASVDAESVQKGSRSVELRLKVAAGPRISLRWSGDDPGKKVRREAEAAWPSYASPDVAAAAVARAARIALQAGGYFGATVGHEVEGTADEVEVALHVARGPKGREVAVEFDGNAAIDERALRAGLPKPGSRAFFEALDGRGGGLADSVRLAYARAGYVDARALVPRTRTEAGGERLVVTIPVRERTVSRVSGIVLPTEIEAAGREAPKLRLKAGEPFDVSAYIADRDAIAAWYRREGWPDARVAGVLQPGADGVSVRFGAEAGPRPRVGDVRVADDGRIRPRLVDSSLTLGPGDLIRPRALAESRERLAELGVFRSVEVRAEPTNGDPAVRDLVVSLAERPDVSVEYGVRYTTAGSGGAGDAASSGSGSRLQFAGAVELSNPFGWGWRLRGYSFVTTDRRTYGANLEAATFFGLRLRTQILLADDEDDDVQISSLATRVRSATFQQTRVLQRDTSGRRWHDRLRLQWGYTFKDILYVENVSFQQLLAGNRAFVSLALIGDDRDSLTDPRRGLFWTATSELARRALGSDVDYVRLYGQLFAYRSFGSVVWAQGYRLGFVPGDDPQLLLDNRFRAGGPTTVRGFDQNGLGPLTPEGDSFGGQGVVVLNQELRFPIWKKLHGGVFWDAGNVTALAKSLSLRDLRQSAGAGLRVMFPFGPVRLEYAWILDRQPGEPSGRFVFGLGHAF